MLFLCRYLVMCCGVSEYRSSYPSALPGAAHIMATLERLLFGHQCHSEGMTTKETLPFVI